MREWKLIRNRDNQEAMVYHLPNNDPQPEFNRSFGRPEDFRFENRILLRAEANGIHQERRRDQYPDLKDLLEAIVDWRLGDERAINALVARIQMIRAEHPFE